MAYRTIPWINGEIYHIYNRGVEKRKIFYNFEDFQHFLDTLMFYQLINQPTKFSLTPRMWKKEGVNKKDCLVEIIAYCLMPNNFHLLLKQLYTKGISTFMSRFSNSYTKYFNTKYTRVGHLFQGSFKAVRITNDEQLIHLSRYIHLNPYVSKLVDDCFKYTWSSLTSYLTRQHQEDEIQVNKELVLPFFKTTREYKQFILDYSDYARTLEMLKNLILD